VPGARTREDIITSREAGASAGANEAGGTIGDLGEFGLIAALSARMPPGPGTVIGIGDDAAVLAVPDRRVVATTDFLLEGSHFRREQAGPRDIGHKAAARSLADIAAMGATPTALLIAFAAPADLPAAWALALAEALAAESARAGAVVAGGDTARADTVILAVTALGDLAGRDPVTRSGARPGDIVAVAGPLGHSAAGFALLEAGLAEPRPEFTRSAGPEAPAPPQGFDALIAAHLRPAPPYEAGPEAADLGATAMIDISDGLIADLGHIADASGVRIDIRTASLDLGGPLSEAASALGRQSEGQISQTGRGATQAAHDPLTWVLSGGEDHSLAATFPAGAVLPPRWSVIGEVRTGQGVLVDSEPYAAPGGWDHFR
jgi:thiamine-monophosphate kinase